MISFSLLGTLFLKIWSNCRKNPGRRTSIICMYDINRIVKKLIFAVFRKLHVCKFRAGHFDARMGLNSIIWFSHPCLAFRTDWQCPSPPQWGFMRGPDEFRRGVSQQLSGQWRRRALLPPAPPPPKTPPAPPPRLTPLPPCASPSPPPPQPL